MSRTFRPWKVDEPLLLPVTVADFVAESHIARFVLIVVRDEVDLCKITGSYGSEFGQPPFNPVMVTALLLYAYCSGIYSSRRIAKAQTSSGVRRRSGRPRPNWRRRRRRPPKPS
jgi:transposase